MEVIQTQPELDSYSISMLCSDTLELTDILTLIAVKSVNEVCAMKTIVQEVGILLLNKIMGFGANFIWCEILKECSRNLS
jgi:hypothetical protein